MCYLTLSSTQSYKLHYQQSICTHNFYNFTILLQTVFLPAKLQESRSTNFNSIIKMPTQGPGTKLVLKGLKLAFPGIAEQRAREEQEDREYSARKHASRNVDGEKQHAPSIHSKAANQENYNAPEDNVRQESVRGGASVHGSRSQSRGQSRSGSIRSNHQNGASRGIQFEDHMPPENINGGNPGSRNQSRGPSRSGSIQQQRSNHPYGASRGSRFEGDMPPENIQRRPSMHSNSGTRRNHQPSRDDGKLPDIEEVRYTHTPNNSRQPSVRQNGPSRQSRVPNVQREHSMHSNSGSRRSHHPSRDEGEFRPDIEEVRYTHTPQNSRQSSVRQDGPSRQSRAPEEYSNMGPRRTASMQGVVGSRGTNGGRR